MLKSKTTLWLALMVLVLVLMFYTKPEYPIFYWIPAGFFGVLAFGEIFLTGIYRIFGIDKKIKEQSPSPDGAAQEHKTGFVSDWMRYILK